MFRNAINDRYDQSCELIGLCDLNEGRLKLAVKEAGDVRGYHADDFDKMIEETSPDCVIVTTRDSFHDIYICRAMELGCDVITEKPMNTVFLVILL